RKPGEVEVLPGALRGFGCCEDSSAALHCPGEQYLRGSLIHPFGDGCDYGILEYAGFRSMTERREGQHCDSVLAAEIEHFGLRQVRMGFDLDHGGLDRRGVENLSQLVEADVRQSNSLHSAGGHEAFHGVPGVEEGDAAVIDYVA